MSGIFFVTVNVFGNTCHAIKHLKTETKKISKTFLFFLVFWSSSWGNSGDWCIWVDTASFHIAHLYWPFTDTTDQCAWRLKWPLVRAPVFLAAVHWSAVVRGNKKPRLSAPYYISSSTDTSSWDFPVLWPLVRPPPLFLSLPKPMAKAQHFRPCGLPRHGSPENYWTELVLCVLHEIYTMINPF